MKQFIRNRNFKPIVYGIAAGLYPVLYFFSRLPDILTSLGHYVFLSLVFLVFPILVFFGIDRMVPFKSELRKKQAVAFTGTFLFLAFVQQITFTQHHKKLLLASLIVAALVAYFLHKQYSKLAILQLLLAVLTLPLLFDAIQLRASYSNDWTAQEDAIEEAIFKKKPNVYFIEPDGYANFTEMKTPLYNIDVSGYEGFLKSNNFANYPNFRSNYTSTLSSNASFFSMKHHYFNNDLRSDEVNNARDIIMKDNPVLRIFKNNGYESIFISDTPYLLATRPETSYDKSNFGFWDVSFLDNGIRTHREDVVSSLQHFMAAPATKPRFFFIQFIKPWHISGKISGAKGAETERELYIERLEEANVMLTQMITEILAKDPEGLIMIMADHGGYVGLNFSDESRTKTTDPDRITTIFSSQLSIHWPNKEAPSYEDDLDSAVNTFRILISYLSENEKYLEQLQDDSSYILLREGTEEGIYSYIDDAGNLVFKKHVIR